MTLSYVWAQMPVAQLQKINFEMLTREGRLHKIRQVLPRTITDAIELLRSLGICLCLIQDDQDDVGLGSSVMSLKWV